MEATAILLNWKRPETMPRIIESVLALPWVVHVIVADNSGEFNTSGPKAWDSRVTVQRSGSNLGPLARWIAAIDDAGLCKTDTVIFQDDDYIVRNWEVLRGLWKGYSGTRIVHNLSKGHLACDRKEYRLVGWGAILDRRWIKPAIERWVKAYPDRAELMESKADRIITALMEREDVAIEADVEELPSCRGDMAMYRQKNHQNLVSEAMRLVREILKNPAEHPDQ